MTSLKGDLRSIMGTPFGGVGHAVLIFSRVTRAAFNSDSVVLQLHDRIEMPEEADGKFRVDGLDPGPIRIELEGGTVHNHGWNIDLPDEGVWSLTDLVDAQVDWSPAVIGRAEAAARESREHADRAEAGADRVGTAEQVGVWASEASSSASDAASARYSSITARNSAQSARDAAEGHANRAATSESNAAASESAAKQSEDNAGDYAAAATTAATEAVDAMDAAARSAASFSIYTGIGSPEGKVAAPVGSTYTDSAATNGAIRWVKTSSTGSTGWRVEYGDTGWRNISSELEQGVSGNVFITRIGQTVHMMLHNVATENAGHIVLFFLSPGFRPLDVSGAPWRNATLVTDYGDTQRVASYFSNRMRILNMPTGKLFGGTISVPAESTWPTTLPGIPA